MRFQDAWWERAVCRDRDPAIFTSPRDGGQGFDNYAYARELCASCPVRTQCLGDAIEKRPTWLSGVPGALLEEGERQVRDEIIADGYSMFQAGYTPAELSKLRQMHERARRAS